MGQFEVLEPLSLTERVAAQLRDAIASGRLMSGERLVEAELASAMGISRAPVREALRQLEFEGLVERRQRGGFVVRALSMDALLEIYNLRVLLEPVLAQAAVARIGDDDVPRFREILAQMRDAVRRGDWEQVVHTDRAFHQLIAQLSGLPLTAQIFEHLNEHIRRFTATVIVSYQEGEELVTEHEDLLDALVSGVPERAGRLMQTHMADAEWRLASVLGKRSIANHWTSLVNVDPMSSTNRREPERAPLQDDQTDGHALTSRHNGPLEDSMS